MNQINNLLTKIKEIRQAIAKFFDGPRIQEEKEQAEEYYWYKNKELLN